MEVRSGAPRYEPVDGWPALPEGFTWGQVVQVIVDGQDRVHFFQRSEPKVSIFSPDGDYLSAWERVPFEDIHSVFHSRDGDGEYLIVVNRDANEIARTTIDGEVVWSVKGERFDRPTDAAVASNGDIYVSDGYGNALVHQLSATGEHIRTWGGRGIGQGEFRLPHGVWIAERRAQEVVYVCDRENWRVQVFSLDGHYLGTAAGARRPTDIIVDSDGYRYITELLGRLTILDADDHPVTRIGGEPKREPGFFIAPHSCWLDSEGSLYITEVLEGRRVQKLCRV